MSFSKYREFVKKQPWFKVCTYALVGAIAATLVWFLTFSVTAGVFIGLLVFLSFFIVISSIRTLDTTDW